MAHDVFISYSSIDEETANAVCSFLEEKGIPCWIAPRDITPGKAFSEAIIDGIQSSKVFVLVYSSNSNHSPQVIKEVDRAVHHGLSIINLRLDNEPLSKKLEYYISDVHWMDATTSPLEKHLDKLLKVVQILLKSEEVKDVEIAEALRKGIIKQNESSGIIQRLRLAKRRTILVSGVLLAVVIAILSLVVFDIGGINLARAGSIKSIVILPFENYTGADTLDPIIAGMHSLLINELGRIKELTVISPFTSNSYKNTEKTIPQITKELNVDAAIELGVLCFGDTICMQPQLRSGGHEEKQLWIGDYRESKGNLFNMYNQIIRQIAGEVKISLTPAEEAILAESRTIDREAIDAYLKGLYHVSDMSPESLLKARDYLNSAIVKDPDWASLYAALAAVWLPLGAYGIEPLEIAIPKAYENTNKAIELDPDLAEAHYINAWLAATAEWNMGKAEKEFLKALTNNPNHAISRMHYSWILYSLQRPEEAKMQADLAYKLDPLSPLMQCFYAVVLIKGGDCASALSVLENVVEADPDNFYAYGRISDAAFHCGDLNRMFEADKHTLPLEKESIKEIETIYNERGLYAAYVEITRQLEILAEKGYVVPMAMASNYYFLNQDDKALEWIEKAVEVRDVNLWEITTKSFNFNRLYDDPRFIEIVRKMNLPLPKSD